jgi:hypothetical protein
MLVGGRGELIEGEKYPTTAGEPCCLSGVGNIRMR